jgi:two-component system response regulator HydG
MLVLDTDGLLDVDDLPTEILEAVQGESPESALPVSGGADLLMGQPLEEVERYYISRALELAEGNRQEAATMLGISERTLYRKIKDFDLKTGRP